MGTEMVLKTKSCNDLLLEFSKLGKKIEESGYVCMPRVINSSDVDELELWIKRRALFFEVIHDKEIGGITLQNGEITPAGNRNMTAKALASITAVLMGLLDADVHHGDSIIPQSIALFTLSKFMEKLLEKRLIPPRQPTQ